MSRLRFFFFFAQFVSYHYTHKKNHLLHSTMICVWLHFVLSSFWKWKCHWTLERMFLCFVGRDHLLLMWQRPNVRRCSSTSGGSQQSVIAAASTGWRRWTNPSGRGALQLPPLLPPPLSRSSSPNAFLPLKTIGYSPRKTILSWWRILTTNWGRVPRAVAFSFRQHFPPPRDHDNLNLSINQGTTYVEERSQGSRWKPILFQVRTHEKILKEKAKYEEEDSKQVSFYQLSKSIMSNDIIFFHI